MLLDPFLLSYKYTAQPENVNVKLINVAGLNDIKMKWFVRWAECYQVIVFLDDHIVLHGVEGLGPLGVPLPYEVVRAIHLVPGYNGTCNTTTGK